jgi:hypothetical protein
MKNSASIVILLATVIIAPAFSERSGQETIVVDIHKEVKNKKIEAFNREITLLNEPGHAGIRLSKDEGEGMAWINGIDFSNGVIEFDVRGEDVKQHSFVGVAFHGKDNATFDAIYYRPFQFKSEDENLRAHSLQYISLPEFPWRTLREKFPNKYESSVNPSPDPNSWVHTKVVVQDATVSIYVNNNSEPSLVVEKVTSFHKGRIGFYVADTSGGDFANITITKAN